MNLRKTLIATLNAVARRYGGFPKAFTDQLCRQDKPYCGRNGRPSRATGVKIGDALLLWEYDAQIMPGDDVPVAARFDPDVAWDIPALSLGRLVRYYLNLNVGYKGWQRFIATIQALESFPGEFLLGDEAQQMNRAEQ